MTGVIAQTGPSSFAVVNDLTSYSTVIGRPKIPAASFSVATGYWLDVLNRLTLSGSTRVTIQGTATIVLFDYKDPSIVGEPKQGSFTVPDGNFYDLVSRLTLRVVERAAVQGNSTLMVSDDLGARSRIVLSGKGG